MFGNWSWGGRSWQSTNSTANGNDSSRVRVVSFHILADCKCKNFTYTSSKYWDYRIQLLLNELMSYDPDIILLQDVDHFSDSWQPKLMLLGYDALYKQRTQTREVYDEGCMIAYKRDKYQLFKSVYIDFNNSIHVEEGMKTAFQEKCKTDDVGIIAFLQPFAHNPFASAICLACALFPDNEKYSDVRTIHAKYLCKEIERANSEFQLPVVVGASLNDIPFSASYHILTCGRSPITTLPPKQCMPPQGFELCRGSVKLKWFPPKMSLGEPQINSYRLCWRPGGNQSLGFKLMIEVNANDCTQFEERENRNGELRAVPLVELAFVISGLASETPYEFKVAAVSSLGMGPWSSPSAPVVLSNASRAPPQKPSIYLLSFEGVLEQSERSQMIANDFDVEKILLSDAHNSETQTTPRLLDGRRNNEVPRGRVLPLSVNPRDGWKPTLRGGFNTIVAQELNSKDALSKTLIRNQDGKYITGISDTPTGKLIDLRASSLENNGSEDWLDNDQDNDNDLGLGNEEELIKSSVIPVEAGECLDLPIVEASGTVEKSISGPGSAVGSVVSQDDDYSFSEDESTADATLTTLNSRISCQLEGVITEEDHRKIMYSSVDDDVVVDCRAIVTSLGKADSRQVHNLQLRSGYEFYSSGGEPSFTVSRPPDFGKYSCDCIDFLLYSGASFRIHSLLVLPSNSDLSGGQDVRESMTSNCSLFFHPLPRFVSLFNKQMQMLNDCAIQGLRAPDGANRILSGTTKHRSTSAVSRSPGGSRNSSAQRGSGRNNNNYMQPTQISSQEFKSRLRTSLDESIKCNGNSNFWGGTYLADMALNAKRKQFWLPNDIYGSNHICLGVELELNKDYLDFPNCDQCGFRNKTHDSVVLVFKEICSVEPASSLAGSTEQQYAKYVNNFSSIYISE